MKRFLIVIYVFFATNLVCAHDLWVKVSNTKPIQVDMIYGHDFPIPETIEKDRMQLFEPVVIIGENTKLTLSKEKGSSYRYSSKDYLKEGSYIVKAKYKPTAWIETADRKWEMNKTRKDTTKKVKQCGIYSMMGKTILNIGNGGSDSIMKPLGKGLEITPLFKASEIKQDVPLKFKVTKDGRPLKIHEVYGNIEGYSKDDMSMAFYGKTNLKGEFTFKALKHGFWYLKTSHQKDSGNKDCELISDKTTFSFEVK